MKTSLAVYSHVTLDDLPSLKQTRIGGPPTYILRGIPTDKKRELSIAIISRLATKDTKKFEFLSKRAFFFIEYSKETTRFKFSPMDMYANMTLLGYAGELKQVIPARLAIISPVYKEVPVSLLKRIVRMSEKTWVDVQGYFRERSHDNRIVLKTPKFFNEILNLSSLAKFSLEEAQIYTQEQGISEVIHALGENARTKKCNIVLTLGKEGAVFISWKNEMYHVKHDGKVIAKDTTGAGDSFMGGLAFSVLTWPDKGIKEHLRFANSVSALVIQEGSPFTRLRLGDIVQALNQTRVTEGIENLRKNEDNK